MEGSTALSLEPFPRVSRLGMAGFIIQFADEFRTDANKAALAFRSYVEQDRPDFVTETSTSLVSVFIAVNPFVHDDREVELWLSNVLDTQNWYHAPLPKGRRLFEIPCVFGTDLAPQLHDAA
ncbi:MAG: carboxyltransferase domain-containing protein, partial [Alphaproteobacteria bacterium]